MEVVKKGTHWTFSSEGRAIGRGREKKVWDGFKVIGSILEKMNAG